MSTYDISVPQSYIKNYTTTNVYPLKTMNRHSYAVGEGSTNRTSLCHMVDPRFNQLLTRHSLKILPYRDDDDVQTTWKHSQNRSLDSTNTTLNQTRSSRELNLPKANSAFEVIGKEQDTHKERYYRTRRCAYMLICGLCIALIVVLIALLFGLPRTSTITTVSSAMSIITTTTTTITTKTTTTSMTTTTTESTTTTKTTTTSITTTTTVSTTTTKTTTTTTESTTTTTATVRPIVTITGINDYIMGLYNTTAGGNTGGSNGMFSYNSELPDKILDGLTSTKYLNYGTTGGSGITTTQSGVDTGFYITPTVSSASIACALVFATANDFPDRDPISITLEGTNATTTAAFNMGSSWSLIYNGSTGISVTPVMSRTTYGVQQNFSNTIAYSSYRLLVTSQRANTNAVQYSEVQIMGYI